MEIQLSRRVCWSITGCGRVRLRSMAGRALVRQLATSWVLGGGVEVEEWGAAGRRCREYEQPLNGSSYI